MSVDIKQAQTGDMELVGNNILNTGFLTADAYWWGANSATTVIMFVAQRAMRVKGIVGRVNVAGTDAGDVTATVYKAPSATALASGTALHSGTFNLKGTAATNQTLTLSTTSAVLDIAAGDTIGLVITGDPTAAVGGLSVHMTPR